MFLALLLFVAADLRLMVSASEEQAAATMLPSTNDAKLKSILALPLTFYTDKEIPKCYQHAGGVHDPRYNISGGKVNGSETLGNANLEFPWSSPAGMHRCDNARKLRFVHFPDQIQWWVTDVKNLPVPPTNEKFIEWSYPEGTVFGEILAIKDGDTSITFELRTWSKVSGRWSAAAYRPFLTRAEFSDWLKGEGYDLGSPTLSYRALRNEHPFTIFDRQAWYDELPALPRDVALKALRQPFKRANDKAWIESQGFKGHAPTTTEALSIVPRFYDAALIPVNTTSCIACHKGVGHHASEFQERRQWYGRVRGSDNIFSFHIFEPSCISGDGFNKPIVFRRELAGLLKRWRQ
jgi:hypothetical protein